MDDHQRNPGLARLTQIALIGSILPLSWLGMMIVHEFGHALAAWCSGGTVRVIFLHPLSFSGTEVDPNPHPLLVAWSGALVGGLLPLVVLGGANLLPVPRKYPRHLLGFFAGFCLVANGGYIGVGAITRVADAGDLLAYGAAPWQLWLFGAIALPLGLLMWHKNGPDFGLGATRRPVEASDAVIVMALLLIVITVQLAWGGRFTFG